MLRKREHHVDIETLSLYIDRRLAPSHYDRISQHLARCEQCRREYESLLQTVHLLRNLPRAAVPRAFTLSAQDVQHTRPARAAWGWMQWATAAVAALLALVISVDIFVQTFAPVAAPVPASERPVVLTVEMAKEEVREEMAPAQATPLAMKALPRQGSEEPQGGEEPAIAPAMQEAPPPVQAPVSEERSPRLDERGSFVQQEGQRWSLYRWLEIALGVLLVVLLVWQRTRRSSTR